MGLWWRPSGYHHLDKDVGYWALAALEVGSWGKMDRRDDRGALGIGAAIAGAVVVVAAAGGAVYLSHRPAPQANRTAHHSVSGTKADETASSGRQSRTPLKVLSVTPNAASGKVSWQAPVTVTYNEPLAQGTALPIISPSLQGAWHSVGPRTIEFKPVAQYSPYATETVTVPAGTTAKDGTTLQTPYRSTFKVKGGSVLRLQELLAELGYLPLNFTPAGGSAPAPVSGVATSAAQLQKAAPPAPGMGGTTVIAAPAASTPSDIEPSVAGDVPRQALAGSFSWRFKNIPPSLASLWKAGQPNVITTGAVMTFESSVGLAVDGQAGPLVWAALLKAAAAHALYRAPYDYVYVSTGSPEYVTVWRDGVNVFTTLANTGIPQSPTQVGTWPVYLRYRTTTMSGTNPNGTHYSDPGIPWVSYFNGGDALHGFIRAQYGFPQSLGCVEMPFASAQVVWPYTPLGTLVTIL